MIDGKELYSDIFFNHQPLAASISYLIQKIFHPSSLYQLVLFHRVFIVLVGGLFDVYFILKFKVKGFLFALLYEGMKYYLFGNRFLAESLVVYGAVFMMFSIFDRLEGKKESRITFFAFPVLCYCVVFLREPFIPLILFLYGIFLILLKSWKNRIISLGILSFLSGLTLFLLPIESYWFNVFTINMAIEVAQQPFSLFGLGMTFLYPVFVVFQIPLHHYSVTLYLLSWVWIMGMLYSLIKREWKYILLTIVILALSNLRTVPVGTVFYESFHMMVWYGLLLVSIIVMISKIQIRRIRIAAYGLLFCISLYGIFGKGSFIYERVNTKEEFNNSYANYYVNGEVIKILSSPSDTLYVEMWDDPVYWQAGLPSAYKYSWYTSIMPFFPVYVEARDIMWHDNPPVFYFGNCSGEKSESLLMPEDMKQKYTQLLFARKPSCIFVRNDRVSGISQEKWRAIEKFEYSLP